MKKSYISPASRAITIYLESHILEPSIGVSQDHADEEFEFLSSQKNADEIWDDCE